MWLQQVVAFEHLSSSISKPLIVISDIGQVEEEEEPNEGEETKPEVTT